MSPLADANNLLTSQHMPGPVIKTVRYLNMSLVGFTLIHCHIVVDYTDADLRIGVEGKNLLSALTAFVEVVVLSPIEVHSSQGKIPQYFKYVSKYREYLLLPEVPPRLSVAEDENKIIEVPPDLPKGKSYTYSLSIVHLISFPSIKIQKSHKVNCTPRR